MDQTDFAIAMVSGVLIIIAIFLFILFKIFGKKENATLIGMALPDIDKIEAREPQKKGSVIEIMGEQKEDISSVESEKTIRPLNETAQIPKEKKEETLKDKNEEPLKGLTEPIKEITLSQPVILSSEENEKLKLQDILIEIRDEKTIKKARMKRSSSKNLEKAEKIKERENPEKKPMKRPVQKKRAKDHVPKEVSKGYEEKSPIKKQGIKVNKKEKKQSLANENPVSGEL